MARSAITREFKVCAGCGAKNRPDWRACQRCRRDLATPAAGRRARPRALPTWAIGAAVVLPAALLAFALGWPESAPARVAAAPPPAAREAAFEVPAAAGVPARQAEAALTPVTGGDFARAGAAAYAQGQMSVALSAFEEAAARFPDDADARNNLGQMLVRLGRAAEAIPHLEAAAAADPARWTFRFNLARARSQTGDWAGAAADYEVATNLFPDDHVTLYNLGRAQQKLGEHAAAARSLERAIALEPSDASFLLTLAFSYEHLRRLPEALQAYRTFLEKDPQSRQAETIRARIGRLEQANGAVGVAEPTALPPSSE